MQAGLSRLWIREYTLINYYTANLWRDPVEALLNPPPPSVSRREAKLILLISQPQKSPTLQLAEVKAGISGLITNSLILLDKHDRLLAFRQPWIDYIGRPILTLNM